MKRSPAPNHGLENIQLRMSIFTSHCKSSIIFFPVTRSAAMVTASHRVGSPSLSRKINERFNLHYPHTSHILHQFYCLNVLFSKNEEANGVSTNSGMEMREAAVRLINRYQHWLIKQLCTLTKPSSNISFSPFPKPCTCKLAAVTKFSISKRQSCSDNDNGIFYAKAYIKTCHWNWPLVLGQLCASHHT